MTDTPTPPAPASDAAAPPAAAPARGQRFWQAFWLAFLVGSLAYAWYSFYVPANSIAWVDDVALAQQQAADSERPMILFFTGAWCVPCRIMKRQVWADDEVAAAVNGAFIPVLVDVDDPAASPALRRYEIAATPTTIITDGEGRVLQRQAGGMDKAAFLALLGRVPAAPGPGSTEEG